MRTSHFSSTSLAISVVALFAVATATRAIAGPGPQYWQQQAQNRAQNAAKAAPTGKPAMACSSCKTTEVTESHPSMAGGKVPARTESVGTTHSCAMCGGSITVVRGKTSGDMKDNCPQCAKNKTSGTSCCSAKE